MNNRRPLIRVFSTSGVRPLAARICTELQNKVSAELTEYALPQWGNENREARVPPDLSDSFVVFVDSHVSPVDSELWQSITIKDAIRNSNPLYFYNVLSQFEYGRGDNHKRVKGVSEMAKLQVRIIAGCGVNKVLLLDSHTPDIAKWFQELGVAAEEVSAKPLWIDHIEQNILPLYPRESIRGTLSDEGGGRIRELFEDFGFPIVQLLKERDETGNTKIKGVKGDVLGGCCINGEDEIAEGGTARKGAGVLSDAGAIALHILATHAIMSILDAPVNEVALRLNSHPLIKEVVVTDSVPNPPGRFDGATKFKKLSVVPILSAAIIKDYRQIASS